jgi:hypothetical protein
MGAYYIDPEPPQIVKPLHLWLGVSSGTVLWALQFIICYGLAALHCAWALFPFTVMGLEGVRFVLAGVTLVATIGITLGFIFTLRTWRRYQHTEAPEQHDPTQRFRFMLYVGTLLNGIFLIGMVWSFIVIFLYDLCPAGELVP